MSILDGRDHTELWSFDMARRPVAGHFDVFLLLQAFHDGPGRLSISTDKPGFRMRNEKLCEAAAAL